MCFQLEKLMKEHEDKLSERGPGGAGSGDQEDPRSGQERRRRGDQVGASPSWSRPRTPSARRCTRPARAQAPARPGAGPAPEPAGATAGGKKDDDAIDAEFEVKE